MRELHIARSFKIDFKKLSKEDKKDTHDVVVKLQNDEPLEDKYRDHDLRGFYAGYRECHIHPDLLLVYKKTEENELDILSLARVSSHTNIFDKNKK